MNDKQVLGLIPARGGSKGIPRKNIQKLLGRPLIGHTIKASRRSDIISETVVSTDDDEIAKIARNEGASVPFIRPSELAEDDTQTEPVISHALSELSASGLDFDDFVLLQPTSPLRTDLHIDEAYQEYQSTGADSLISVYSTLKTRWDRGPDGASPLNRDEESKRRQDREPNYVPNGAIYITSVDTFMESGILTAGRTTLYEMREMESVDIDTPYDLWLAERILEDWHDNSTR